MSKSTSLTIETQTEASEVISTCHVNERMLALETSFVANKMLRLNKDLFVRINKSTKLIGGTLFRQEITRASTGENRLHVGIGNHYDSKDVEIASLAFKGGVLKKQKRILTKSGKKIDFDPLKVSNENNGGFLNPEALSPDDIRDAELICTVEEMYLFQDTGVKSFIITDNLKRKRSLLEVGYQIQLIVQSDFKGYVEYVIKEAESSLKFLTTYLNSLSFGNIYDSVKLEFKKEYAEKVMTSLGIDLGSEAVDLGQSRIKNSEFGRAAMAFYNLQSLLSPSVNKNIYSKVMKLVLPTNKTTPIAINSFIRNFNSTLEMVRFEYFRSEKQTKKEKKFSRVPQGSVITNMVQAVSTERLELEQDLLGYSVFSDTDNVDMFSRDNYKQRLVEEQAKYYPKIDVSDTTSFLTKKEAAAFGRVDNAPAFLTPTSLVMGDRRIKTRRGMNNVDIDDIRQFRMAKSIREQQKKISRKHATNNKVTIDALSALNVTISSPKIPILTRSISQDIDPLVDAKYYVGDSSGFTTSNPIALLKNFKRIMSKEDKRILSITADIIPRRFLRNRRSIDSIKEIQFSNPHSIVRKLAVEETLPINSLPPQVKFMMSKDFNPNPLTDPLKNSESREIIEETQKNLFVIRALVGFEDNENGFLNVHSPLWRQMSGNILESDRPTLAKAEHYEIPELGVVKDNFLATIYSNLIYIRG